MSGKGHVILTIHLAEKTLLMNTIDENNPKGPAKFPLEKIAFIDLEASGLNAQSWPVEIGWAFYDGDPVSTLICPDESWPLSAWDDEAQALHGISIDQLNKKGRAPEQVCTELNDALEGFFVFSDAPEWDGFWLYRLFSVCRMRPAFSVLNYLELLEPLISGNIDELVTAVEEIAPRRHRAADDAKHLQMLYQYARKAI